MSIYPGNLETRSKYVIEPAVFTELMQISDENTWLKGLSNELAELWNFSQSEDEKRLIKELLRRFVCCGDSEMRILNDTLVEKLTKKWKLLGSNTYFIPFGNAKEADGSKFLIQSLKNRFAGKDGWGEKNFKGNIGAVHEMKNGANLVLVDDFIGTGKTVGRKLDWIKKVLNKRNVTDCQFYLYSLAAMKNSFTIIEGLDITWHIPQKLERGISDSYSDFQLFYKKSVMFDLESRLGLKYNRLRLGDFNFGYNRSETLYTNVSCSMPNNNFPIFWWPVLRNKSFWNTLFKRLG